MCHTVLLLLLIFTLVCAHTRLQVPREKRRSANLVHERAEEGVENTQAVAVSVQRRVVDCAQKNVSSSGNGKVSHMCERDGTAAWPAINWACEQLPFGREVPARAVREKRNRQK